MPKKFNIQYINDILRKYNQKNLLIEWNSKEKKAVFQNNYVMYNKERLNFYSRIRNYREFFIENHDLITSNDKNDKEKFHNMYEEYIKKQIPFKAAKASKVAWENPNFRERMINHFKNRVVSDETRKKISAVNTGRKHSEETKNILSKQRTGSGNPMYGYKYSQEQRDRMSQRAKNSILKGKFTPNSNNKNTHWNSFYNNQHYRSSWECLFQYFEPSAQYEQLRIPYKDKNENYRIYIVDFIDYDNKVVTEIKPSSENHKNQEKFKAAQKWCNNNGFQFQIIDENILSSYGKIPEQDKHLFDSDTIDKIEKFINKYQNENH